MRGVVTLWAGLLLIPMGASLARAEVEMTILAMGDSTTAGTPGFRSPVEAPPDGAGNEQSQYTYWAERLLPGRRFLNRGVAGEHTGQILKRLTADLNALRPDSVVLLAGVNDLFQGTPPEQIQKNLERMYQLAKEQGVPVVACTILPCNGMSPATFQRMRQINEWIRKRSQELGLGFCDLFSVMEDPNRPGNLLGAPDGLHPDVDGYRRMGEAVAPVLRGIMGSTNENR